MVSKMFGLFSKNKELIKSNKLAEQIMDYQIYNPYLMKCDNKEVRKACKDCYSRKDVFHTAIKYIEDDTSPKSLYLLARANLGLGVLYNERTIYYCKKYLESPINYSSAEEKYKDYLEICIVLADCYKKDYIVNEELKYRELSLEYANLFWDEYKKHEQIPSMEYYENRNIRKRITELNDDIKIAKKVEKQTNKMVDLNKPLTTRKVLERIDVKSDNIYNLITGEVIE